MRESVRSCKAGIRYSSASGMGISDFYVSQCNMHSHNVYVCSPLNICTCNTRHILLRPNHTRVDYPSLLPKQAPLLDLKRLQYPLSPLARLLQQRPHLAMLQIHASSLKLPSNMRDIDGNKHISLLLHQPNQSKHNHHELWLIGSALLFGAWRGSGEEVVGWYVGAVYADGQSN